MTRAQLAGVAALDALRAAVESSAPIHKPSNVFALPLHSPASADILRAR